MVLNRFSLLVLIQIVIIALLGLLILLSLQMEFMKMTTAGLILLWVGMILFLNVYMNRIHRDVKKFMDALRSQDTSQYFNERKGGLYFKKLYSSFNEISRNFRLVRIEKEVENQFYREVIRQSASGILAVTEDRQVKLINGAALEILGIERLGHLSELNHIHPDLEQLIGAGGLGGHQLKVLVNNKMIQLALNNTEMFLEGTGVRICSLLDISNELARSEIEAWQKLIRVLHHEITNSVVPLHILATSLFDLLHHDGKQKSPPEIDKVILDRLVLGIKTIEKRSSGLNDFINTYGDLTRMGDPVYSEITVKDLLSRVVSLMEEELAKKHVEIEIELSPAGLQLSADENLLEQILINLIKNSLFALEGREKPTIRLNAWESENHVYIEIRDNGKGIPEELIEKIFTPFFTTRKGGSGIGLSLARQVMYMHKGSIHVNSQEGKQSTFTLMF